MHSPPETLMPRINGICFFTRAYTFSGVISVAGELSWGTDMNAGITLHAFRWLQTLLFHPLHDSAPTGHCFTQTPHCTHSFWSPWIVTVFAVNAQPCKRWLSVSRPSTLLNGMILDHCFSFSAPFFQNVAVCSAKSQWSVVSLKHSLAACQFLQLRTLYSDNSVTRITSLSLSRRTGNADPSLKETFDDVQYIPGFLCTVISIGKISPVPEVKYLWNFFNTFSWSMSSSGSLADGNLVPGVTFSSSARPTCA